MLILSDVLILSSFGLIAPIFAIFIKEDLIGGSLVAVGLATTIFWVTKSAIQLPLSMYIDKHRHKVILLIAGTLLIVLVPFIYSFAKNVNHIFIAQVIYGFGTALAYPTWFSLFTTYMDKKHKGFEWAIWSTSVGVGIALTAYLGAELASTIGFDLLFFIVGLFSLAGFILLFFINRAHYKGILKEKRLNSRWKGN